MKPFSRRQFVHGGAAASLAALGLPQARDKESGSVKWTGKNESWSANVESIVFPRRFVVNSGAVEMWGRDHLIRQSMSKN